MADHSRKIILAFWLVVLFLGLPLWQQTTSTYRASLPLDAMSQWAEGQACDLRYPIAIKLNAVNLAASQAFLATKVQHMLNEDKTSFGWTTGFTVHHELNNTETPIALTVNLDFDVLPNTHDRTASLMPWDQTLNLKYRTGRPDGMHNLATWITQEVQAVFRPEQLSSLHVRNALPSSPGMDQQLTDEVKAKLDAHNTRAFKYASTYHLTFSLFSAAAIPSAWDIEQAIGEHMQPLITALTRISDFTIDTQVQLHASLSPSIAAPQYQDGSKKWELQKSDLSAFINAAEWPLNPSIGVGPTINFVLYVPDQAQTPLHIEGTNSTSWLVPQWGGVTIFNPNGPFPHTLTAADLQSATLTFAEQLTQLIGVPAEPASMAIRIASATRHRAISLIRSASSTLGALSRLTLKLTSIAIPDTVASAVDTTIGSMVAACSDIKAGRYNSALSNARTANDMAEKAFFEPSMVGQVYFPDEHKVAVYVPLLGPMAVPLVLAVYKYLSNKKMKEP
jgi:GPI-anchor transamidase subunit S